MSEVVLTKEEKVIFNSLYHILFAIGVVLLIAAGLANDFKNNTFKNILIIVAVICLIAAVVLFGMFHGMPTEEQ